MTAAACPAIFYADSAFCVTFWQNLAIVDSRGLIDVPHMLTLERAYQTLASRFTAGIVSCVVIQPGTPVSPPDALRESARFMRELGSAMMRIAVVIEDVGVAAQVFRTVVRGINIVIRDNKLVVLGDLPSAVEVLAPLIVPATDQMNVTSALTALLHSARARYASLPPASVPNEGPKSSPWLRS
ncbi:MAG TPA: hypothetical protein VK540_18890 [Polyangiaceae bacterium]|jgi:hypothetical protein|nr:hypothetical protein [Polyangiaceae bacterium]